MSNCPRRRVFLTGLLLANLFVFPTGVFSDDEKAPSPQALCKSMLMIIGWNDLTESANQTNADRVAASGLIRILGSKLAAELDEKDPRYEIFFPPKPGIPHEVTSPPEAKNVAGVSTQTLSNSKENVDRLTGLLFDGRHNWRQTRYFFMPYDPLKVAELSSMWQRHARNAVELQESGKSVFGGDKVLGEVQAAVEQGLHGNKPFWAHIGFEAKVEALDEETKLVFHNAGPGYRKEVPNDERVLVDYILMYDPTDSSKPSGMTVVLRFPDETP